MKRKILLAAVVAVALINTLPAQAADRKVMLPLAAAMADNDAQSRLVTA